MLPKMSIIIFFQSVVENIEVTQLLHDKDKSYCLIKHSFY